MRSKKDTKKGGFVITAELILIATVLVIGLLVGLVEVRNAVVTELDDVAEAIGAISQTYTYQGVLQGNAPLFNFTDGSAFQDARDITFGGDTLAVVTTISPDGNETSPSASP